MHVSPCSTASLCTFYFYYFLLQFLYKFPMDNIVEISRIDNLSSFQQASNFLNTEQDKNTIYFSTNANDLSAKFIWNINGPKLEVYSFDNKCNNRLISFFDFSQIFNDPTIAISLVTRLADRFEITHKFLHPYKLIVILSLTNSRSYICTIDVRLNSIINTIDFPFNITCAEVVLSGAQNNIEKWPLTRELMCMNGILVVGCDGGLVFFIDLILDSYSAVPLIPKQVSIFTSNSAHIDLKNKRRTAIFHNQVICIPLNSEAKNKGKFNYRTDDGKVIASFLINQVYVSSLYFIPQLSLICVGYDFGGFHLYNLNSFKLECSCGLYPDLLPVISFVFQAPENDPKNYSYLWVVRGFSTRTPNLEDVPIHSCSTAFLYLLGYENKEYIDSYGILYNTFKHCCCKFEFPLTFNPYDKNSNLNCTSKLLDIFTIHQVSSLKLSDEDNSPIDTNLLFIAWQAFKSNDKPIYYFLIFDLNQYYKTQMPKCFCVDDNGLCPFISIYSLNSFEKISSPHTIQAIYFHNNSIKKFSSNTFYLDIHSYPISLSFDITVASQSKICNINYLGFQKQLMSEFIKTGPNLLINPSEIVAKCFRFGLISPEYNLSESDESFDIKLKREMLLNVAMENNLSTFFINVIREWSSGEYASSDCDLKFILEWIWKRVSIIKESIDSLTKPLFDFSGCKLSQQDIAILVSHQADLSMMSILLKQLVINSTLISKQGFEELSTRREVVELIRNYLKIILLFEDFNLLPEHDPLCPIDENLLNYSYEKISDYFCQRRKGFISINPALFNNHDVLLIDIIVRNLDVDLFTSPKSKHTKNIEFESSYPPKNIHSIVRMFLLESVPLVYKESILLYFLFDLCDYLSKENIYADQKISLLMSSVSINQGLRYFIQGIWFLDHQNFDSALQFLTHPMVTSSLADFKTNINMFNEIMQRIVELFLFENHYKSALCFTQCCGHFLLDTEQNENLYIQMLLLNDNITSAFEFQRQRRCNENSYQLLYKLFFVCEKINSLVKICKMPLDSFEEMVFVNYLLNSDHHQSKPILVLYFVLNNKLLEAINIVKEFEPEFKCGQENNRQIFHLIEAYSSVLPHSLINLANEISDFICEKDQVTSKVQEHDNDMSVIKIKPKQRNIPKISSSNMIEKMLEAKEFNDANNRSRHKICNHSNNSFLSPISRKNPIYLSPSVSKSHSKITKAKHHNVPKDLFSVLKTPDIKKKMAMLNKMEILSKKPILKQGATQLNDTSDSEFDRMSESHKLKVSFSINKNSKPENETILSTFIEQTCESEELENFDAEDIEKEVEEPQAQAMQQNTSSNDNLNNLLTPNSVKRKSRLLSKKSLDTPTHRMKLRSKKT